jgi:ribosomal protein S6--L-glutamate ligase
MIVSFHPIIEAHKNIICAGRQPGDDDLAAIERADAVILPQGCSEALYRMARSNCPHVFPNLNVRFDYPGKRGQIQLFERLGLNHPKTHSFDSVAMFHRSPLNIALPSVVKFDWGGEGDTVFLITNKDELDVVIGRARQFEASGQYGFLVQRFIATQPRSLRVVVIGSRFISYWRIPPSDVPFGSSVAHGAVVDHDSDPDFQAAGKAAAKQFCRQTGLQLAGFDFIFNDKDDRSSINPIILEINYYFGRAGLGGSDKYYKLLTEEVDKWLANLSMRR